MNTRNYLSLALLCFSVISIRASAADTLPGITPADRPGAPRLFSPDAARQAADQAAYRKWKFSLAPLFASQTLDVASSYGMRELNPVLAGSDGRFGAQAAGIKLGATAAIAGVEYLIVRKHPRAARTLSKINWSVSIVTTGFAAHNFSIR